MIFLCIEICGFEDISSLIPLKRERPPNESRNLSLVGGARVRRLGAGGQGYVTPTIGRRPAVRRGRRP